MSFVRSLVTALVLCFTALVASPARAQVTLGATVNWSTGDRSGIKDNEINRADCLAGAEITFTTTVAATGSVLFEVWAGSACGTKTNRDNNTNCFRVAESDTNVRSITVPVRNLVQPVSTDAVAEPGADVCEGTSSAAGPIPRSLFFLVLNPGTLEPVFTTNPEWAFSFDVTPPDPPTGITAGPGEESLILEFDPPTDDDKAGYNFYCSGPGAAPPTTGEGGADSTTDTASLPSFGGFRTLAAGGTGTGGTDATAGTVGTAGTGGTVGTAGTGGTVGTAGTGGTVGTAGTGGTVGTAGTTAAGGADAGTAGTGAVTSGSGATGGTGTTGSSNCSSSALVPGSDPTMLTTCGTVRSTTASSGRASGLANGTESVVAVATVDKFGNVGRLSDLACGTPAEVTGFFEAYRDAGGQGGGGFCSFGPPGRRGALAGLAFSLLVLAGLVARRRR